MSSSPPVVLAAVAHPDDVEFMMAGTLLRLAERGCELHIWNLANGCCGSNAHDRETIAAIRAEEARAAAELAGARWHEPIADDMAIFYQADLLSRCAAVLRQVRPAIVLTHAPQDYMEDHQNTCRLVVSACFARGMRNFPTEPPVDAVADATTIYHALPHGLRDGLGRLVRAGQYVDIEDVLPRKRSMLACHRSQKQWLDESQGMDCYLDDMEALGRAVGRLSGRFAVAEGWRRHSWLGFADRDRDPLAELLGEQCYSDPDYQAELDGAAQRAPQH